MRGLVMIFGLLVVGAVAAPPAGACTCVPNPPPREAFQQADAVFVGEVIGIEEIGGEFPLRHVTLRVERPFKGVFVETVAVWTAQGEIGCGFPFEQGRRYLVYAHRAEDALHASFCSRTARLEDARADLDALDALDLLPDDDGGGLCGGLTNVAALQGLLFVLLGVALLRRRQT